MWDTELALPIRRKGAGSKVFMISYICPSLLQPCASTPPAALAWQCLKDVVQPHLPLLSLIFPIFRGIQISLCFAAAWCTKDLSLSIFQLDTFLSKRNLMLTAAFLRHNMLSSQYKLSLLAQNCNNNYL